MLRARIERFDNCFWELFSDKPSTAPAPSQLNKMLGYRGRNLDGQLSARRIMLLKRAGFKKINGRWRW